MSRSGQKCAMCMYLNRGDCPETCMYSPYFPPEDITKLKLLLQIYTLGEITVEVILAPSVTEERKRQALDLLYREANNNFHLQEVITNGMERAETIRQLLDADDVIKVSPEFHGFVSQWASSIAPEKPPPNLTATGPHGLSQQRPSSSTAPSLAMPQPPSSLFLGRNPSSLATATPLHGLSQGSSSTAMAPHGPRQGSSSTGPIPEFGSDAADEKLKTLCDVYPVEEMRKIVTNSQYEHGIRCQALNLLHEEAKIHLAMKELTRKQREVQETRTQLFGGNDHKVSIISDLHKHYENWCLNLPMPEDKGYYNNQGDEHVPGSNPSVTDDLPETIRSMLQFTAGPVMSGQSGLAQGGSSSTLPQPLAGTNPPPTLSTGDLNDPHHQVPANQTGVDQTHKDACGLGQSKKRKT